MQYFWKSLKIAIFYREMPSFSSQRLRKFRKKEIQDEIDRQIDVQEIAMSCEKINAKLLY